MFKKVFWIVLCVSVLAGCASVPMESLEQSMKAKEFNTPKGDKSGLYIYRNGFLGSALKKDIWVNETCVGETAPDVFFYTEVDCGKEHKISTESEFSPNDLIVKTNCGENHFFNQFIKLGAFVGGADLQQVSAEKGKDVIKGLELATAGTCSSSYK